MKHRLLQALSRLASAAYQEAYMVSGTKNEYVVPEDLVEEVASLCRVAMQTEFAPTFDASQLAAISTTLDAIKLHGPRLFANSTDTTAVRLVREDQDWAAMRESAADTLSTFGVDALALQASDIDGHA